MLLSSQSEVNVMAGSEAQRRANRKYYENKEQIKVDMPKGTREMLSNLTNGNETAVEFIRIAIKERIERLQNQQ